MINIPKIELPIVIKETISTENLFEVMKYKNVVIFGVPGAFTPTCSERHLPGFIKLSDQIKSKGIDDIYCLSVNDAYVIKSWLQTYVNGDKIKGIADGNAEFSTKMNLSINYSINFMGIRSKRFALIAKNNLIKNFFVEEKKEFSISSAEHILTIL